MVIIHSTLVSVILQFSELATISKWPKFFTKNMCETIYGHQMVDIKVKIVKNCKIVADIGFWTPFWLGILGPWVIKWQSTAMFTVASSASASYLVVWTLMNIHYLHNTSPSCFLSDNHACLSTLEGQSLQWSHCTANHAVMDQKAHVGDQFWHNLLMSHIRITVNSSFL